MRVPPVLPALPLLLLGIAALAPGGAAQGHEHGALGPVLLTHDGPVDGRQFAGNLAHFAAIAHGEDAIPDFHQDVPMRVSLDGRVLFETTPDSGHDYDGINAIDVVFPHPGTYLVEALGADGAAVASFGGEVLPAPGVQAHISQSWSENPLPVGQPLHFTYDVRQGTQGNETRIDHSDCLFELVRDGATWFRTKTHTHIEAQELDVTFPEGGTYTARTTCFQAYPSAKAILFAPVVSEQSIGVLPSLPVTVPAVPDPDAPHATPPTDLNAVVLGAAGGELQLVGTYDPYTVVGTDTLQHLTVAAIDPATGQPRQHVDFTARLDGPTGLLFASQTLHEYDGLYELATRQPVPGVYTLTVAADAGSWGDRIQMAYTVVPAAAPTSAGPVAYTLEGTPAAAGEPAAYTLTAAAAAGPFAHSEVELRVLGDGPVPLLQAKLHTHDDGAFPFRLALPQGRHELALDGFPLTPDAVLVEPAEFDLLVPAAQEAAEPAGQGPQALPAPGLALLGLALAALAVARRRS